jgi:hypothetical protein
MVVICAAKVQEANMRVLIDETGLPWAVSYYSMFPFEPSRYPKDDMTFTRANIVSLKNPTLVSVMKEMLKSTDKEVMLVSHGNEDGLVMQISHDIPLSSVVSVLKWLPTAADAFDLIDTSSSLPQNNGMLDALAEVEAMLEAQADKVQATALESTIRSRSLSAAGNDVANACARVLQDVISNMKRVVKALKTTEKGLREAAGLTKQIRDAQYARIEVRACNIGSGDGIEALRAFFAAKRLMAPTVHTFYVSENAPDTPRDRLEKLAASAGPRWRLFYDGPTGVPLQNLFRGSGQLPIRRGSLNFMLSVTRVQTPRFISDAYRLNGDAVKTWVTNYINPQAVYSGIGTAWVGGLDAPTPDGKPYTLPLDDNYRSLIAVATASDVDR